MKPFTVVALLVVAFGTYVPAQAQYAGYCPTCFSVIAVSDVTGQTSSQSIVTLVSPTLKAGNYMIRWYADVKTPCSLTASGTGVTFTFTWADATATRNFVSPALTPTTSTGLGNYILGTVPIYAASGSTISYISTYSVTCGGTSHLAYDVHVSVETTQ
jgi:hypothetical protein